MAYISIGRNLDTGEPVLLDEVTRESGMSICGIQGTGKSSLLESMIHQDIVQGSSVLVVDPHGDLIFNVMKQVPQNRLADVYLLDLSDAAYPFGINVLDLKGSTDIVEASDRVVNVFKKLFPSDNAEILLNKALDMIVNVLNVNPGASIGTIAELLTNEQVRHQLLKRVTNRHVLHYWQQYDAMTPAKRALEMAAIANRLPTLLKNSLLENIMCQPSTIDFRKSIDKKEITLIRLDVNRYPLIANIIGTVLLAEVSRATFSYLDMPRDDRPGFSVYIDEFSLFSSDDFARLFTQGRKCKIRLAVSTQYRNQLKGKNFDSFMTPSTILALCLTTDDARGFSSLFYDPTKPPTLISVYRDVLKHLSKHESDVIYRFYEEVVIKLLAIAGNTKHTFCDEAAIAVKRLASLLYQAQKTGAIDDDQLGHYMGDVGWFYGYTSAADMEKRLEDLAHEIVDRMQEYDALHSKTAFFRDREQQGELDDYYLLRFYEYYYPDLTDVSRVVSSEEVLADTDFWNSLINPQWRMDEEVGLRIAAIREAVKTHAASYTWVTEADYTEASWFAREKEPLVAAYTTLSVQIRELLAGLHELKAAHMNASDSVIAYHREQARLFRQNGDDLYPPAFSFPWLIEKSRWKAACWLDWLVGRGERYAYYDIDPDTYDSRYTYTGEILLMHQFSQHSDRDEDAYDRLCVGIVDPVQRQTVVGLFDQYVTLATQAVRLRNLLDTDESWGNASEWRTHILETKGLTYSELRALLKENRERWAQNTEDKIRALRSEELHTYIALLTRKAQALRKQVTDLQKKIAAVAAKQQKRNDVEAEIKAVLAELIGRPIGEYEQESVVDVARKLAKLPPRHGMVVIGQGNAKKQVISFTTEDRPACVDEATFQKRLHDIQSRTRQKYCRPRQEVERLLASSSSVIDAPEPRTDRTAASLPITEALSANLPYQLFGDVEDD